MKRSAIFRSLCLVMTWVYLTAVLTVQAGQVVTAEDKAWAKEALKYAKNEKNMAPISASNTVAVLYFNNKTGLEDMNALQKGMAIMLITDLAKVPDLQVVERIKVQALLDEMELGTSGLVDPTSAPKVGKLLGAYYVSNGEIILGKMAQLNIKPVLIDVPFGTVTPQAAASGNLQDLFRMEKEILFHIIEQMKVFLTPRERDELKKPLAASTAAALAFFAGIHLSDQGKYVEAASMYEKAIAEDQGFALAKDALGELKSLGLAKPTTTANTSAASANAADEGMSTGTIVLLTLGALAVGGGVAALALSSGDDNSSTSGGVLTATNPLNGARLNQCLEGTLVYSSSISLQSMSCTGAISPTGWTVGTVSTRGTEVRVPYYVSRNNESTTLTPCTTNNRMTVAISGCRDAQGNIQSPQSFSYIAQ
jgi:TolB-like protein